MDFKLLNNALAEYEKHNINNDNTKCTHEKRQTENGSIICLNCGIEIDNNNSSLEKEWRFYGGADTKHNSDPNRCYIRKNEDKSIYKDVENMGFSEKIINMANNMYTQVTKGKIYRGNSRKAIVFACIFYAYKINKKIQTCDQLLTVFGLTKKSGLKGIKHVNSNIPKDSDINIRENHITPSNLVKDIMDKFEADESQIKEVIDLYENKIKNKSTVLNRARPQSVSAGLIYYWICQKKKDITIKQFIKKVKISELTINKMSKEIDKILND